MTLLPPLQNLSVDNVIMLLGQNVVDLQKARSHPIIISWLHSKNRSTLDELRLDKDPAGPTNPSGSARLTTRTPNTTPWVPHLATTSGRPGNDAPTSGTAPYPALPLGGSSLPMVGPVCLGPLWNPNCYLCPVSYCWPTLFLWLLE